MLIVSLDPGGTTGWASYDTNDDDWESGELGPGEHHQALWKFLRRSYASNRLGEQMVLICEAFEHRNAVAELISNEYIGIAKLFVAEYDVPHLSPSAADMKRFGTNDKLRHIGILERPLHPKRHINDAKRHLLTYLCTKARPDIKQRILLQLKDLP